VKAAERDALVALGRELAAQAPPLPDYVIDAAARLYVAAHTKTTGELAGSTTNTNSESEIDNT